MRGLMTIQAARTSRSGGMQEVNLDIYWYCVNDTHQTSGTWRNSSPEFSCVVKVTRYISVSLCGNCIRTMLSFFYKYVFKDTRGSLGFSIFMCRPGEPNQRPSYNKHPLSHSRSFPPSSHLTLSLPPAGTAVTPKSCTSWARWSRGVTPTTLRAARSEVTRCPRTSASCTPTTCSCGGSCTPTPCCPCCSGPTGTLPSTAAAWRRTRT